MAAHGKLSEIDMAETKRSQTSISRLRRYQFQGDENSKTTLGLLLDEVAAVDSHIPIFQSDQEGSEVLGHLSRIIPPYQDRLVAKMCLLTCSICAKRNVALTATDLQAVMSFLTNSLQQCQNFVYTDLLAALTAVCENNTHRIQKFHDILVGGRGILLQLTDDTTCEEDIVLEAVKCLAAFCNIKPHQAEHIEVQYLSACFDTFVHLLHRAPHLKMGATLKNKLLVSCLGGIQSIVLVKRLPNIELGTLFAAVRAYLFYGLTSHPMNIPSQLFPNVVTPYDPLASTKSTVPTNKGSGGKGGGEGDAVKSKAGAVSDSGRKKPRRRKGKGRGGGKDSDDEDSEDKAMFTEAPCADSGHPEGAGTKWSGSSVVSPASESLEWADSGFMLQLQLSSSDSEYSDTEGGHARRHKAESVRVRHSALICFLNIVRVVEKKMMFGYWSSFLPDISSTATAQQTQSLFTVILKDPSPQCRMAAVASLTCMLEATRNLLAAAQDVSIHNSAPAFTTFSAALGATCREMHRCLLQALAAENFNSVLTQIIKCLSNLVSNVPYHRLNPGLLTKVLKQIRHFFNHKDPNVRTACLTCIGTMVGIRPPLMEVSQLIRPPVPPVGVNRSANPGDSPLFRPEDAAYLLYPSFSTPQVPKVEEEREEDEPTVTANVVDSAERNDTSHKTDLPGQFRSLDLSKTDKTPALVHSVGSESTTYVVESACLDSSQFQPSQGPNSCAEGFEIKRSTPKDIVNPQESSVNSPSLHGEETSDTESVSHARSGIASSAEGRTPVLAASSGECTPMYLDQTLQAMARETSWVIKFSVKNIIGQPDTDKDVGQARFEPLPIRLEALQVISNLVKNYFPVIRQSVSLLRDLIQSCVKEDNATIQLHGCKVLDEFTQALHRDVLEASQAPHHVIPAKEILEFWLYLLEGCLPKLLSYNPNFSADSNNLVRSAACESMGNIGEEIFSQLPMRRQMQCVTLVLGMVAEGDKLIKAAAVRALGIYVLYPSLREDVPFVLDAAKAILSCMDSKSKIVRFKAAWALANLCDTLVANRDNNQEEFMQDFPDSALLQLIQCAAPATKDSDKISCNCGRAIGNLLRYMPGHCFQSQDMGDAVADAVKGLVRNMTTGAMKVRWNSCYAASNAFRNPSLPVDQPWMTDILNMLAKVVQTCSNFKVRINAALGLSALQTRHSYGSSETFSNTWTSLVAALESSENINDFAEYKYKDSLIENLCGAVLHVTSLIDLPDLTSIRPSVHLKGHSFRMYMEKYIRLNLTNKGMPSVPTIEAVKSHLESLQAGAVTDEQRRCLQDLIQACVPEADATEEQPVPKSSFKQIYD